MLESIFMSEANSLDESRSPASPSNGSQGRISVALCTYNGSRFLDVQLESILAQNRQPYELVVCDDRSTDDTVAIVERFARRAPFPVRIEQNPTTLGSTKNFEKAIRLCTGDFIATCDQDDVWLPEKLALSHAALAADPARGLVFSDADVVDDSLRSLGHTMWQTIHFGRTDRRQVQRGKSFEVLLRKWLVTGATMMFRADFLPFVLPIPESWIHDGWIAFIVSALAPIGFVDQPLIKYRQHAAQQIGGKKLTLRDLYEKAREVGPVHYRLGYERFLVARERLQSLADRIRDRAFLSMMDGKVLHQQRRLQISESRSRARRIWMTLAELIRGRYTRYSPNSRHFIKDMIF
jgi:glycosyltransferase involved in cell wall biosynthesis